MSFPPKATRRCQVTCWEVPSRREMALLCCHKQDGVCLQPWLQLCSPPVSAAHGWESHNGLEEHTRLLSQYQISCQRRKWLRAREQTKLSSVSWILPRFSGVFIILTAQLRCSWLQSRGNLINCGDNSWVTNLMRKCAEKCLWWASFEWVVGRYVRRKQVLKAVKRTSFSVNPITVPLPPTKPTKPKTTQTQQIKSLALVEQAPSTILRGFWWLYWIFWYSYCPSVAQVSVTKPCRSCVMKANDPGSCHQYQFLTFMPTELMCNKIYTYRNMVIICCCCTWNFLVEL